MWIFLHCFLQHCLEKGVFLLNHGNNVLKVFTFPDSIYLFKVNSRNTRIKCEICSKLTIKNLYGNKKQSKAFQNVLPLLFLSTKLTQNRLFSLEQYFPWHGLIWHKCWNLSSLIWPSLTIKDLLRGFHHLQLKNGHFGVLPYF